MTLNFNDTMIKIQLPGYSEIPRVQIVNNKKHGYKKKINIRHKIIINSNMSDAEVSLPGFTLF